MPLQTGHLRRCIRILESAYDGLQEHETDDTLYDIHRAACVKEFELVPLADAIEAPDNDARIARPRGAAPA